MIHVPVQTTPLQDRLIDSIVFIMKCWKNSNDFSSPTLHTDIYQEMNKFYYDGLKFEYVEKISDRISSILTLIQDADDHIEKTV